MDLDWKGLESLDEFEKGFQFYEADVAKVGQVGASTETVLDAGAC